MDESAVNRSRYHHYQPQHATHTQSNVSLRTPHHHTNISHQQYSTLQIPNDQLTHGHVSQPKYITQSSSVRPCHVNAGRQSNISGSSGYKVRTIPSNQTSDVSRYRVDHPPSRYDPPDFGNNSSSTKIDSTACKMDQSSYNTPQYGYYPATSQSPSYISTSQVNPKQAAQYRYDTPSEDLRQPTNNKSPISSNPVIVDQSLGPVNFAKLPTPEKFVTCELDSNIWRLLERTKGHDIQKIQRKHKIKFVVQFSEDLDSEQCSVQIKPTHSIPQQQLFRVQELLLDLYRQIEAKAKVLSINRQTDDDIIFEELAVQEVTVMYESVVIHTTSSEILFFGNEKEAKNAKRDFLSLLRPGVHSSKKQPTQNSQTFTGHTKPVYQDKERYERNAGHQVPPHQQKQPTLNSQTDKYFTGYTKPVYQDKELYEPNAGHRDPPHQQYPPMQNTWPQPQAMETKQPHQREPPLHKRSSKKSAKKSGKREKKKNILVRLFCGSVKNAEYDDMRPYGSDKPFQRHRKY